VRTGEVALIGAGEGKIVGPKGPRPPHDRAESFTAGWGWVFHACESGDNGDPQIVPRRTYRFLRSCFGQRFDS
jgi:hypothetical protein